MDHLQEYAQLAAKYVNSTHRHIFLTGKAGSGKTTFLKYIIRHTFKKAVVAAPTGVAAINAGGVTLHSLLQLPFGTFLPENVNLFDSENQVNTPSSLFRKSRFNATKRQLIRELELLIIDEVSMLRADLLDCIDHTLRFLRKRRNEPFGGVQMLFIGDLMQLPPVVKENEKALLRPYYSNSFFFQARALQDNPPVRIELTEIYRQSDLKFIDLLNRIRNNEISEEDVSFLNGRCRDQVDPDELLGYIFLTTHNHKANRINQQQLRNLPGKITGFEASVDKDFPDHMFPSDQTLQLKEGAQVMFIKNDPTGQERFFNGKMGWVSSLDDNEIWVRTEEGDEMPVERYQWENKRYTLDKVTEEIEEKVLGTFEQYPLRLAWAVTIHKSQGLTFEKAILDLSDAFAPGQLYVALSRLTSLDGLIMASPIPQEIPPLEKDLQSFTGSFPDMGSLTETLTRDRVEFIRKLGQDAFQLQQLLGLCHEHAKNFNKSDRKALKEKFMSEFMQVVDVLTDLQDTATKFLRQIDRILGQENDLNHLNERSTKASEYFVPKLQDLEKNLETQRQSIKKERKLKAYFTELQEITSTIRKHITGITRFHLLIGQAVDGKMLTRETLVNSEVYKSQPATKKEIKIPTAQISYEMFRDGKSVEEIAETRGLVSGTIEGHLSQYIAEGTIDVKELVSEEKLKAITSIYESGTTGMGEIKSKLGEEFTYGDVKMVLAHINRLESKS